MTTIKFATSTPLTPMSLEVLKSALVEVYGDVPVNFVKANPGPGVLGFGVQSGVTTITPKQMTTYPNAQWYLVVALRRLENMTNPPMPWGIDPSEVLFLDIETHNAGKQWSMTPREFFRLGQYAWGPTGSVVLTTDYDEVISAMESATLIIAHNGHSFDLSVLLKDRVLDFAQDNRVFDTMVFANLALPAPSVFTMRDGRRVLTVDKEGKNVVGGVKKWLSLDNLAYQLNVPGKEGDLKELAKRFNPDKTAVRDLDYSLIPVDDPDFLAYAEQDVKTLQDVTTALMWIHEPNEYDKREQLSAAINAQMTRNGFCVDEPKARARVQELTERKAALLEQLAKDYGFPTEGAMPWRTTAGKAALMKILADYGITPETHPEWEKTKTGNLSLGGDALVALTTGSEAEELGQALAELQGQRPLAQQALDHLQPDGRVHHDIVALQRSGRCSTTGPSLTTWSAHGPKAIEKEYFIASPGRMLMEFDLSNADQRVLAAISEDSEYAKRFEPGVDGHEINGRILFTDSIYETNHSFYRNESKACIAEGQKVLTDHGLVPIEAVSIDMKVWDGVEWVTHDGVVYRGEREVITYDGLTATEDHIIFAEHDGKNMEIPFGLASSWQFPLTKTGVGRRTIRVGKNNQSREDIPRGEALVRRSTMFSVLREWLGNTGKSTAWVIQRLSSLWS